MTLESAFITETGSQRPINEDRYIHDPRLAVFGVADGIGGLPFGSQAAECAAQTVLETIAQAPRTEDVARIVSAAHRAVIRLGDQLSPDTGIGTTLTACIIRGNRLHLAHVGDSRCYRFRDERLECLTQDDTIETEIRRRRALGEHIDIHESDCHTLTRCIGQPDELIPSLRLLQVRPGDLYLFATDGVTRLIPDDELETVLRTGGLSLDQILRHFISEILQRGSPDNATAVLVRAKAD